MSIKSTKRWLLPDGVQETLPPDALAVEALRHDILQLFHNWGYDLVMPAMIEYMDSLLTGTAHSLDTRTFALVDQLSGKQMGVRSDMTPQVARIDAHLLADNARQHRVSRLCYCGHLLHAIGDGINSSRTPIQIGAEIFGSDAISADVEVVSLMVATLHAVGLHDISLDLGHVGVFRSLVKTTGLDAEQEDRLFDMLQRKSIPDLQGYLQQLPLDDRQRDQFYQLALLNGDAAVIDEARAWCNCCSRSIPILRYTVICPSCAATAITPGWCSRLFYPARAAKSLAAVAMTMSVGCSVTPGRQPVSAPIY
jgi:ATP phosphoribosyltransferase regulatory subunit